MELLGYTFALIIGITLGLIGGGGSILAVPVLAYIFSINEKEATAYSLFIIGLSSLIGGLKQHFKGLVDWRTAFVFGVPAIIGVTFVRGYIIPILPNILFTIEGYEVTRRMLMFGLFALLMVPAAFSMLKSQKQKKASHKITYNYLFILIEGLVVGSITGFIGAGGGFLIIPALVVLAKMEIKLAIGTSLIIIASKSLLGFFLGDALLLDIDWNFLSSFTSISLGGILIGSYLSNFIDSRKLKRGFGYFIITMSGFIFYMEFYIQQT